MSSKVVQRTRLASTQTSWPGAGALNLRLLCVAGPIIRPFMPEQHRTFFGGLPMLMVGALAPNGRVVAHALTGAPGFVRTPTHTSLAITPDQPLDPGALGHDFSALETG